MMYAVLPHIDLGLMQSAYRPKSSVFEDVNNNVQIQNPRVSRPLKQEGTFLIYPAMPHTAAEFGGN